MLTNNTKLAPNLEYCLKKHPWEQQNLKNLLVMSSITNNFT